MLTDSVPRESAPDGTKSHKMPPPFGTLAAVGLSAAAK